MASGERPWAEYQTARSARRAELAVAAPGSETNRSGRCFFPGFAATAFWMAR